MNYINNCSRKFRSYIFGAFICSLNLLFGQASFAAPITKVDIFLLFDDTGSFSAFAPTVKDIFTDLVDGIETGLPGVDVGFGVGRFEDYGGPGWDFCSNHSVHCVDDFPRRVNGRPFFLNQPIVTSATAGGSSQRDTLILNALDQSGPGTGGDDPESHIEALWQIINGSGFDGNDDATLNGSDGTEVACANVTQINPDESGDVPAFTSLISGVPFSGALGGAGFRPDALKLVIIATEICAVMPFSAGTTIPSSFTGRYSTEAIADFACFSTTPGDDRFGFVSNAKSFALNTVANAVVPKGSATFQQTINALNTADVRVLAMGPGLAPKNSGSGPGHEPSGFLSALARITGGVDSFGTPLVLDMGIGGNALKQKIVQAILAAAISNPGCLNQDLTVTFDDLSTSISQLKKLAVKLAKKTQSQSQRKKTSKKIKKLVLKSNAILQSFPKQATVCQNNACPATDHSDALKTLNKVTSKLNKMIKSSIKKVTNKKQASKFQSKAANLMLANTSNIETVPDHTNNCE